MVCRAIILVIWSANALPAVITHGGCLVLQETFEPNEALEIMAEKRTVFYGMTV